MLYKNSVQISQQGRVDCKCIIGCVGMQGEEAEGGPPARRPTPDQSAPRAAPSLSAPIDFYYKNFARGFFLFPAHQSSPTHTKRLV